MPGRCVPGWGLEPVGYELRMVRGDVALEQTRSTGFLRHLGNLLLAVMLAAAAALWVLAGHGEDEEAGPVETTATVAPVQPLEVGVIKSRGRELIYALPLRGFSEASRRVEVRAETSGLVAGASVPKGTTVAAGDLLCRIRPGERPALLAQARARVAQARADAVSARTLAAEGYGPETAATAAEAGLASARAEIERIEFDIARTEIRAPFGGVLETGSAETGTLLQPGALCATVLDLAVARIVGFAPERVIDAFSVGIPARATLSTGREVMGVISFVARSAEPRTRTFRIEISVDNADGAVRDGMGAEILFPVRRADAHQIPQSALTLNGSGEVGLRTVVDGRAAFVAVELLHDDPDGVWVRGLPAVASVIVVGQEFAADGAAVVARPAPGLSVR